MAKDPFVRSLVAGSDGVPAFVHPIEFEALEKSGAIGLHLRLGELGCYLVPQS